MILFMYCTEGEMSKQDVLKECVPEGWIPLLVLREDGTNYLPFFPLRTVACKFAKRNLPSKWHWGLVELGEADVQALHDRGFMGYELRHPRLVKDVVEISIEVHHFVGTVTVE